MPARPAYFHRITEALEVLRKLESDWIDRRTLEETLGVSKTVAWRIMRRCGATGGPGGALVRRRLELVEALEALERSPGCDREIRRRGRLEERLSGLLAAARSKHVRIAPESRSLELVSTRLGKLPPGVELTPGRLTVDFFGTEDFLEKVGAIVFALQNDYQAITEFIEQGSVSV
jgi:hypothetical protein